MKIVVSGARGLLGHEVVQAFSSAGHAVVATDVTGDLERLDITDRSEITQVIETQSPDWIINCAAFTQVDACETQAESAFLLNAEAPGRLAEVCGDHGVRLLHISSDYVFDGEQETPYGEDDAPHPINVYGKSKHAGEQAVMARMDEFIIVRPQWLFGPHGPNFVATILGLAKERSQIQVVNDQWGSPTYSKDLAKGLRALVENDARGIYHVCNRGVASWFDLAQKAVDLVELETEVVPVDSQQFPRPARRPRNSTLSTKKFTSATGKLMPPWQLSLQDYIRHYLQQARYKA